MHSPRRRPSSRRRGPQEAEANHRRADGRCCCQERLCVRGGPKEKKEDTKASQGAHHAEPEGNQAFEGTSGAARPQVDQSER